MLRRLMGFLGWWFLMPPCLSTIKNNITIYDRVFRPALVHYGMWDQVVVDQGRQFYLTLSAQTYLGAYRTNPARAPYIQIPSTKNNRIERVWVEVNRDVNFPVKRALETMVDDGRIIPSDPTHLLATSRCGCSVTTAGLARLLAVRNARHCRGRGVPEDLMRLSYRVRQMTPEEVPDSQEAASSYHIDRRII